MLSDGFPPGFFSLALAHALALLSPGQDFFLLTAFATRYGAAGAAYIAVGIALGNACYIVLAIIGWQWLAAHAGVLQWLAWGGAIFLIWMGWQLLLAAMSVQTLQPTSRVRLAPIKQLLLGLASALLNPKNGLFYMSLMAAILGPDIRPGQLAAAGVWMFTAVLLWDVLLVKVIGRGQVQQRLQRLLPWIERIAAVVLMVMGLLLLLRQEIA